MAMITNRERNYVQEGARQHTKQRHKYIKQAWLGKLSVEATYQAIDLLAKQHRLALAAMPSQTREAIPLEPCSGVFTQIYGLPCSHIVLERLQAKTTLTRLDVHPR